jgi:tyrosine-protein kinase
MQAKQLKKLVRKWALLVVALTLLGGGVAYAVSRALTPIYEAQGSVLVIAGPNQTAGAGSLTINATQATTTAATLLTEPPLLQTIIDQLHLGMTTADLGRVVSATPQANTELVEVLARDPSATRAALIDNALMKAYVNEITTSNTQRINAAGAALQAQITDVQKTISTEQQDLVAAENARQDATALKATISANEALLSQLTLNYSSFQATQSQNLETVSIAAAADVPLLPASPRPLLNTVLGILAGFVLGSGLVALLEYLDQGLHNADDVVEKLGLPCLGIVPRYRTSRVVPASSSKAAANERRHVEAASEAYRRLRTNVLFSNPDSPLKSILITSVRSGEGKTCTAANLAVALANSEKRVLLIDADMRRPDQHRLFGKKLDHGMSELILETSAKSIPSVNGLHGTTFPNLSLLTSGTIPPNPSELLASNRAHLLLERLAEEHDLLVIDTPPAGMVTDALTVAAAATVTVMVVEAGKTNAVHAAATIESLRAVGANVVGVVLNKARDRSLSGYYYRYGYGPEESDAADMDPRRGTGGTAAQWAQSNLRSRRRERPLSRADQLPRRTMAAPGSDGGVLDGRPPPSTGR